MGATAGRVSCRDSYTCWARGVALIALGLVVTDRILTPKPGACEENFKRLRKGMTRAQVEALLGGPPSLRCAVVDDRFELDYWEFKKGVRRIYVRFKQGEGLNRAELVSEFVDRGLTRVEMELDEPAEGVSPLARLRAWLGW